jgi:uncharacterized protein (TIGR00369 family)
MSDVNENGPIGNDNWGELLGLEILEIEDDLLRGRLEAGPRHHQPYGILHGGVYASIVEAAGSIAAGMLVQKRGKAGVVGVSNHTDFLRSHSTGWLDVEARALHAGRRTHLWEVSIRRASDGALVSRGQLRLQVLDQLPAERTRKGTGTGPS